MKAVAKKPTLRSKFILVIMICCSTALLLNNALIFQSTALDFKKNKVLRLFILADVLANNSTAALKFSDKQTAKEILQSSVADSSIKYIALFDEHCEMFEENKDHQISSPIKTLQCNRERYSSYSEDYLYLSIPVMLKQEQIGTLFIVSGLKDLEIMLSKQAQVFFILFLLTLILAFIFSFKLQTIILTPIKNLLSAIKHISLHKDYSIQVQTHTHDELAMLADEFNKMIGKIHHHDMLLNDQNQLLEQTVEQRTLELNLNLEQLKKAKVAAEIANQAKSDFLSHMSHDLRTPLNSLLGYVQILQRKADFPPQYLHEIQIIEQSSEYLLSLINDLLDLTKIESNTLELTSNPFNTTEFLNPIVGIFSKLAEKKRLRFNYSVEGELPPALLGDKHRIRRILSNLLENAFKYTELGSISFSVQYQNNTLNFTVTDSGCGIKKENLQAIFKPFNQFAQKINNDGVGLGLYITQYLVKLMQGTLTINSELHKGTSCILSLPLAAVEYNPPSLDQYDSIVAYQGEKQNILIVDDTPHNLDVLEAMLSPLGFNVICVDSGIACLDLLQKQKIHIILLDMVMPVLNGIETCQRIQQLKLDHLPKIIMVTANAFNDDREKCLAAGCDDFLAKPVIIKQLLLIIEKQLNLQWLYQTEPEAIQLPQSQQQASPAVSILIADDDEICRLLMAENLKEINQQAVFAEDGNQALKLIQNTAFDCIILDYKMPHQSGLDLAAYIQLHETPNKNSYLTLMTAMTGNELNEIALKVGFHEVLGKPVDLNCLNRLINTAYKHKT